MSEAVLPPGWPAMSIQQAHALLGQPGLPTEIGEATIRGVPLKVWKNQPPTLRAVAEMAKTLGDKVFRVYEDERVTYDAFYRAVAGHLEVEANIIQSQSHAIDVFPVTHCRFHFCS